MIFNILAVGIGASGGALLRFLASKSFKPNFLGTLCVNLIGSFFLGCLSTLLISKSLTYAFLGTGFCGGLTTFSTFNYELLQMFKSKQYLRLSVYGLITYISSFLCLILGIYLSK